jgi:ribosomal protein S18 acetylase RimI-like enzyme
MTASDNSDVGPTRADEADQIVNVAREAQVFSAEEIAAVEEMVQDYLTQGESSHYCFLSCRLDGRVAGFTCYGKRWFTRGTFDLYWIVTSPGAQRRGVGGRLLDRVEQNIYRMGGRLVIVETSSRPEYEPARRFYDSRGYRREALIKDFYDAGDSLVLYSKKLD